MGDRPSFLISEAIRGFGGILKTPDGKEFMHKYDKRGSLAPRDIVARAIDTEMKQQGYEHVCIDVTNTNHAELVTHFPNIYEKCLSLGIDMKKDMIPVIPAAHYLCGGVIVDKNGHTTIKRLYAAGESTYTGLHGANRLASNSLLEAIVYADNAATHSLQTFQNFKFQENMQAWNDEGTSHPEELVLIIQEFKELQMIMSNYVGIVRSNLRLKRAFDRLEILYRETEELYEKTTISPQLCELRNAINIGYLVIKMARRRKESRGLHYTLDYPNKNKLL
jgi:L-aspartate oxidase